MWEIIFYGVLWAVSLFVAYSFGLRKGHGLGAQRVADEWRKWINEQI